VGDIGGQLRRTGCWVKNPETRPISCYRIDAGGGRGLASRRPGSMGRHYGADSAGLSTRPAKNNTIVRAIRELRKPVSLKGEDVDEDERKKKNNYNDRQLSAARHRLCRQGLFGAQGGGRYPEFGWSQNYAPSKKA